MLFSQNPISGEVECYTDDGEYIGKMVTMGDDIEKEEGAGEDEEEDNEPDDS